MKVTLLAFVLLAHCAGAARLHDATKTKGLSEVVTMLKDMLKKSQDAWKTEKEAFVEYKEYCETNTNDKTDAIAEGKKDIALLQNRIDEIQGGTGKLSVQVAKLKQEMAANEQSREEATSAREKSKKAYEAEKADLETAIGQLDEAITILGEVGADQTTADDAAHKQFMAGYKEGSLMSIKSSVQQALTAANYLLNPVQQKKVTAFLQAPFTGTYTAQSGQVIGILKNMKMTFETNLEEATANEEKEVEAHEKFMKNKKEEYDDLSKSYDDKQGSMGDNDDELGTKKETLTTKKQTLEDDEAFLEKLTEACGKASKGYEVHEKYATSEQAALQKAIAILDNDVTAEHLEAPKFIQLSSRTHPTNRRASTATLLQKVAKQQKSKKLNQILLLLQAGNPFTVVLEQIDKMVELCDKEQKVDDAEKAWCEDTNAKNEKNLEDVQDKLAKLEDDILSLKDQINGAEEGLKASIQTAEEDLKTNLETQGTETKDRRTANLEYQKTVHDMADGIDMLRKAKLTLTDYYDKLDNEELGFIQIKNSKEDPKEFDNFDKPYTGPNKAGQEVIGLIDSLIEEKTAEENTQHEEEAGAQHDYEDSMKELTDTEAETRESIIKLNKELTEKEKTLEQKYEEQTAREKEEIAVKRYIEKINGEGSGCEFILGKYDTRKTQRDAEKKALEGAKEKLKGTPAFKSATRKEKEESMGECKEKCLENEGGAECKACLAGISVPGYCAGHPGASGC